MFSSKCKIAKDWSSAWSEPPGIRNTQNIDQINTGNRRNKNPLKLLLIFVVPHNQVLIKMY